MLSSFLDALLKLPKTSSPQKLFDYDCATLYLNRYIYIYYQNYYLPMPLDGFPIFAPNSICRSNSFSPGNVGKYKCTVVVLGLQVCIL